MYEQQREHTRGARFNLETQILTIENANINLETLQAMKVGSSTMRQIHGEMDINKVDETMDDIREQMDLANEISTAISNPLGFDTGIDEGELEEELERLEQAEFDAALLDVKAPAQATATATGKTAVPAVDAKTKEQLDEERELEELRASMAL